MISEQARQRIEAAIASVEQQSRAELVAVIARRAGEYRVTGLALATIGAFLAGFLAWLLLPDLPLRFSECGPQSAVSSRAILAWYCGRGALYLPAAHRWRRVPAAPGQVFGAPVAAGDRVRFAGAAHEGSHNRLFTYVGPNLTGRARENSR